MDILTFALTDTRTDDTGTMTARIVPFGESVTYGGEQIRFERGGLEMPGPVPLTIDHGDSVLDRVGVLTGLQETDQGAYASFDFADTATARDVRALLTSGAVTDVSVGVSEFSITKGVMSGTLDHVSVVPRGRFGTAQTPSKVLSVHDEREPMGDENTGDAVEPMATYDDTELRETVAELNAKLIEVAELATPDTPAAEFAGITAEHLDAAIEGAMAKRADFALADVVGDLGTADAAGLNPDFYWADGLLQNIDRRRPLFAQAGTGPFPSYGLNLTSAKVSQEVAVGSGKAQKAETETQALQVVGTTFPVVFHSGAVDVAMELISQSNPAVVGVLRNSFLRAYATATNTDIVAKALAGATASGAALDTSTYAALVGDLITTSNLIEDATGMPGDKCAVTSAEWIAILALMDGGDRRQFATVGSQNADGSAGLTVRGIDVGGIYVFRDPIAANAFQFNDETLTKHEKAPSMVQATNVPNMGVDMGIIGATAISFWAEGLYKYTI